MITKEELEKAIHNLDLILHPFILFVNPSEEDRFKEALKNTEFEDKVIVQPDSVVEVGKAIIMDRKKLEDWGTPEVKFDFESDKPWVNNSFGYPWSDWSDYEPHRKRKTNQGRYS